MGQDTVGAGFQYLALKQADTSLDFGLESEPLIS
jgi:hypothetical protein